MSNVRLWQIATGVLASILLFTVFFEIRISPRRGVLSVKSQASVENAVEPEPDTGPLQALVLPAEGIELPVTWGDLGTQMVAAGVIDSEKMKQLYEQRGGLGEAEERMLNGEVTEKLRITQENSGFILNMLWALGLGTKSSILEKGPMQDPRYGGAGDFASTGGWTLAKGDPMKHYSAHPFLALSDEKQQLVERVAKNIYRPCCNNSTYLPDCNHGMAMLGLLELLAAQGASEEDMYRSALAVNSYWFPDTYVTVAKLMEEQGTPWEKIDPQAVLGAEFSSSAGFREVIKKTQPAQVKSGGGGCSV